MKGIKITFGGFLALILIVLPLIGACGEKEVVKEVVKEVPVEKEVVKEVVKEVPVEKEVVKEVVKEVPVERGILRGGAIFDLSGPYAFFGGHWREGMTAYAHYRNTETDGVAGNKVEFIFLDDGSVPERMLSNYTSLEEMGCTLYFSPSTQHTLTLNDRLFKDNASVSYHGDVVCVADKPSNIFSFQQGYADQYGALIDWVIKDWEKRGEAGAPKVAMVVIDHPMGYLVMTDPVYEYIEEKGIDLVTKQTVPVVPVDVTPQIAAIKNSGADYIVGHLLPTAAAPLLKQASAMGLAGKLTFLSTPTASIEDISALAGEDAEGFIAVRPMVAWTEDLPAVKKMTEIRNKLYPDEPDRATFMHGWLIADNACKAWELALERTPAAQLTPADVTEDGFKRIDGYSPGPGITGKLSFKGGQNYGNPWVRLYQIQNGKAVAIQDWTKTPNITGCAPE